MSEPTGNPGDIELAAVVEGWLALPEEQRTRVVQVPMFETLLARRFGTKGIAGNCGAPAKVQSITRVIDERPCDLLRDEDSQHDEPGFVGSGAPLYDGTSGPFLLGADDPQRPVSE